MKKSILSISSLFFFNSIAFANINEDFKLCATEALKEKQLVPGHIRVDNESNAAFSYDHNSSSQAREYRMLLTTESGKSLGSVACTYNKAGELQAVTYLSKN